jgi:hypothetical protein
LLIGGKATPNMIMCCKPKGGIVMAFPQPHHRKSKFGLRHAIKLNELYLVAQFSELVYSRSYNRYFIWNSPTFTSAFLKLGHSLSSLKVELCRRFMPGSMGHRPAF